MDGAELGTEEVASSGRSRTFAIPEQSPGAHILSAYAEVSVNDVVVRSNTLTIGMLWISETMSGTAILSPFATADAVQGEILTIPYMVYDPQSETAVVTYTVLNPDGTVYSSSSLTVDRTAQNWVVQNYPVGNVTFRIACGDAVLDRVVAVSESSVRIDPVTDALGAML